MSNEILNKVSVLYEDADCVVLNKPAGLMVHPDGKNEGPFLTDWLIEKYPALKGVGETQRSPEGIVLDRPGIVHRLDKDTSGALLVAKTPEAHAFFKAQFQDRSVSKKYLAFVWGDMKESFGTIDRPIGRNPKTFSKWSAQRGARGEMREAETYWTRLWTGESKEYGVWRKEEGGAQGPEKKEQDKPEKFSLVQVEPKTGRTHQIRVHFLAVNHPVVSDSTYADTKPKALGFDRLALHSWKIGFKTKEGKKIEVVAPLPEDFDAAAQKLAIKLK